MQNVLDDIVKALKLDDTSVELRVFNLFRKKFHLLGHFDERLFDFNLASFLPAIKKRTDCIVGKSIELLENLL